MTVKGHIHLNWNFLESPLYFLVSCNRTPSPTVNLGKVHVVFDVRWRSPVYLIQPHEPFLDGSLEFQHTLVSSHFLVFYTCHKLGLLVT